MAVSFANDSWTDVGIGTVLKSLAAAVLCPYTRLSSPPGQHRQWLYGI